MKKQIHEVTLGQTERARAAFTLIELLAVIVIIGILAGIVISVVSPIRQKARTTQCLSNMRQAGLAFSLYANDNRNLLPVQKTDNLGVDNDAGWVKQIKPWCDTRTLLCPESKAPYPSVSYYYNSFASTFSLPGRGPVSQTEASAAPARYILLLDGCLNIAKPGMGSYIITVVDVSYTGLRPHPLGSERNGGRTVLFMDGHVSLVRAYPENALNWKQLQWPNGAGGG
ncbi:MAG: type II secretion system GspH family protein [Opitutaceae bacterium]|jgi:prepilin-type N-terminal cleavage/methylation domain-containing protein/prepilin-type processing-associated H-X9-DG protein|nr:type II secretion system GspH family protein [Opitutaceae bacterium]